MSTVDELFVPTAKPTRVRAKPFADANPTAINGAGGKPTPTTKPIEVPIEAEPKAALSSDSETPNKQLLRALEQSLARNDKLRDEQYSAMKASKEKWKQRVNKPALAPAPAPVPAPVVSEPIPIPRIKKIGGYTLM